MIWWSTVSVLINPCYTLRSDRGLCNFRDAYFFYFPLRFHYNPVCRQGGCSELELREKQKHPQRQTNNSRI